MGMGIKDKSLAWPKLQGAAPAGFIAITVNTMLLKAAPLLAIKAESGGLLKLTILCLPVSIQHEAFLHSVFFWLVFHYFAGFAMVYSYLLLFRPWLPGPGIIKGSLFSLLPWLLNSFFILPALGQGPAGLALLPASGILYFFLANLLFGLVLGGLYERGLHYDR